MATTELVTVATQIDPELHRRLERKCDESERSKAAEMRRALRAYLDADREPATSKAAA